MSARSGAAARELARGDVRWPAGAAEVDDAVEDRARDGILAHLLQALDAPSPLDERDDVRVDVEPRAFRRDVVGDHEMNAFGLQLTAGVGDEVARLGGESDQNLRAAEGTELGENVGVRHEAKL